jgi:tetratricopeptide (TPR) repeat protein
MLKRSPTHPAEFYYDLGIVYALNGRLDDAEERYKRAIALEPSNELFFKAIQAARQGKEDQKKLREQLGKRP